VSHADLARLNVMWNRYPRELCEVIQLRGALENLPDQLAPLVAPVADEDRCRQILQDHLEAILKETAARIERLGQQLAGPPTA
jgi:DNA-binding GntR family transcriptional regulator